MTCSAIFWQRSKKSSISMLAMKCFFNTSRTQSHWKRTQRGLDFGVLGRTWGEGNWFLGSKYMNHLHVRSGKICGVSASYTQHVWKVHPREELRATSPSSFSFKFGFSSITGLLSERQVSQRATQDYTETDPLLQKNLSPSLKLLQQRKVLRPLNLS